MWRRRESISLNGGSNFLATKIWISIVYFSVFFCVCALTLLVAPDFEYGIASSYSAKPDASFENGADAPDDRATGGATGSVAGGATGNSATGESLFDVFASDILAPSHPPGDTNQAVELGSRNNEGGYVGLVRNSLDSLNKETAEHLLSISEGAEETSFFVLSVDQMYFDRLVSSTDEIANRNMAVIDSIVQDFGFLLEIEEFSETRLSHNLSKMVEARGLLHTINALEEKSRGNYSTFIDDINSIVRLDVYVRGEISIPQDLTYSGQGSTGYLVSSYAKGSDDRVFPQERILAIVNSNGASEFSVSGTYQFEAYPAGNMDYRGADGEITAYPYYIRLSDEDKELYYIAQEVDDAEERMIVLSNEATLLIDSIISSI